MNPLRTGEDAGWSPTPDDTPFARLGGEEGVHALAEAFYDAMERHEPELAALHALADGHVSGGMRQRFGLFLVGWLGGPQEYTASYGPPRLRLRHGRVPVDAAMRDAWLRCMARALDARGVQGPVRHYLDARFAQVADFLRNQPG